MGTTLEQKQVCSLSLKDPALRDPHPNRLHIHTHTHRHTRTLFLCVPPPPPHTGSGQLGSHGPPAPQASPHHPSERS